MDGGKQQIDMIEYNVYEMSRKERLRFNIVVFAAIACVLNLFYKTPYVLLASLPLTFLSHSLYKEYQINKRKELLIEQFRDLLYSFSASVAAGRPLTEAVSEGIEYLNVLYEADTPMLGELAYMKEQIEAANEDAADLFLKLGKRSGIRDITIFAEVWKIAVSSGADLVKVIGITSQILIDKVTVVRDIKAYVAQKRFEGRVIAVMPVFIIAFLNLIAPDYLAPLYGSIQGFKVMTLSLIMTAAGYYIMEYIMDIRIWDDKKDRGILRKVKRKERTKKIT